jgi:hypothetical protein
MPCLCASSTKNLKFRTFFRCIICFCTIYGSFRILKMSWENISFLLQTWVMKINYYLPLNVLLSYCCMNICKFIVKKLFTPLWSELPQLMALLPCTYNVNCSMYYVTWFYVKA